MQNIIIALIILAVLIYIKKRLFNLFSSGLSACGDASGCRGCNSGRSYSSGCGECPSQQPADKPEETSP